MWLYHPNCLSTPLIFFQILTEKFIFINDQTDAKADFMLSHIQKKVFCFKNTFHINSEYTTSNSKDKKRGKHLLYDYPMS